MDSKTEEINSLTKRLFIAIKDNNTIEIQSLIQAGANLAAQNELKQTPIHYAAKILAWESVRTIAECKSADKNDTYQYGGALLLAIIKLDTNELPQILIEAGANTTAVSSELTETCLHYSIRKNKSNTELLELLLKHKAKTTETNKNGQTPLDLAAQLGHWSQVQMLIRDPSFKNFTFPFKDQGGLSFIEALKAGELDIAKTFLKAGASPYEITEPDKNTALHWVAEKWASFGKTFKAVTFGCDQTALNAKGKTAIEVASELGHWDYVHLLIEAENKSNPKKNDERFKALHCEKVLIQAIKQKNHTYTQVLLEMGVTCNTYNDMGTITVYWAIKNNTPKILQLLITHGANITRLSKTGQSSLDLARELNYIACVEVLEGKGTSLSNNKTDLIEATRSYVTKLFDSLCDEDIKREKIPATIDDFIKSYRKILEHDKTYFQEQRLNLRKQTFKQAPFLTSTINTANINTNTKDDPLKSLLRYINGLLDNESNMPTLGYVLNENVVEERDVQYYLECMSTIDDYKNRVHIFLMVQLKTRIENLIKNIDFFDHFVCPIPSPIYRILEILKREELSQTPSMGIIWRCYLEVIREFANTAELKQGDKNVQELCSYALDYIKLLKFELEKRTENVMPVNSSYAAQFTINETHVPNNTNAYTLFQPQVIHSQMGQQNGQMYPYETIIHPVQEDSCVPVYQQNYVLESPQTHLFAEPSHQNTTSLCPPLSQYGFLSNSSNNKDTLSDNPELHVLLGMRY